MKVIGFCGLPGSGKTTALEAVNDLGIIITMGDVIRKEAIRRDMTLNDDNLGKVAKELRLKEGDDIIAEKTVEIIKKQNTGVIFIDGLRSLPEVEVFKKEWKFPLIAIITNEELRYKRISDRSRSDDGTEKMIKLRDKREKDFGLEDVIKIADFKIENNSTIVKLKEKTRICVLELISKY